MKLQKSLVLLAGAILLGGCASQTEVDEVMSLPSLPSEAAQSVPDVVEEIVENPCHTVAGKVLDLYLRGPEMEKSAWTSQMSEVLSDTGVDMVEMDPSVIRAQQQVGLPSAKDQDLSGLVLDCEGRSTTTGWLVSLSRSSVDEDWEVDAILPQDTSTAFLPR